MVAVPAALMAGQTLWQQVAHQLVLQEQVEAMVVLEDGDTFLQVGAALAVIVVMAAMALVVLVTPPPYVLAAMVLVEALAAELGTILTVPAAVLWAFLEKAQVVMVLLLHPIQVVELVAEVAGKMVGLRPTTVAALILREYLHQRIFREAVPPRVAAADHWDKLVESQEQDILAEFVLFGE